MVVCGICSFAMSGLFWLHLQSHSGEQAQLAYTHLHFVQSPLLEHLINSLHPLETSGIVIQTGTYDFVIVVFEQAKCCGDGDTCCT